jgi:molybdenum cofactor synthesis domain-containing protein
MIRGTVLTVSDRSAAELREDVTGPLVVSRLRAAGFDVSESRVVPDGEDSVREALTEELAAGTDFVVTLGGTGVGPRDQTPEGTAPLLVAELPGIAEELRRVGLRTVPTAVLSRGLAGIAEAGERRAFVVNIPGSRGAAEDGLTVLVPLIPHIVDQLSGGDHG